jgi:hypothetical protein
MDLNENLPTDILPPSPPSATPEIKLVDIKVLNENVALNLMVSFLSVAQKRGVFSLDEAAKIWECVQKFHAPTPSLPTPGP